MRPCLLAIALMSAGPLPSVAQTGAQAGATPAVSPDRPDRNPRTARERSRPASTPHARARIAPIAPFTLRAVQIERSSLPPAALEAAWRPFVGQRLDTPGLVRLTDALAAVYARNDIAIYTVLVPDQTFADGVLRVRTLEGHVDEIRISGPTSRLDRELVDRYAAKLRAETPLRRSTLERQISLIRDIPGLDADMQLKNGQGADGVRLDLVLTPHPVQVGLSINNRGTAYLGRTQAQADLYFNSLLRQGDRTRLTFAVPTDVERFQAYAIEHSQPIGADGLTVSANAGYLRTRPEGTDIRGHAKSAGVQLSYPLIRGYSRDVYVTLGLDGVDADNAFLGFTFSDERTRALRAALSYSAQTDRRLVYGSATLSQGIAGLGARATPGVSERDFRKLNARAGANFAIADRWAVRFAAAGQWTGDRLAGTEQFTLGGDTFGRGYAASIIAGDYGYAGSVEAAWRPPGLPTVLGGSEAYAFVDGGKVWYRGRLGAATDSASLRSAGLGVRAAVAGKAVVQLEAAKPLSNSTPFLDDRGWRGVFAVRTLF